MARPTIGVTSWSDMTADVVARYHDRVTEAGGDVLRLDEGSADRTGAWAREIDALVLTGGIDVAPERYGAERHAKVKHTDLGRDAAELAHLEAALALDIPVLAICRGHQLLNVGFGGSLLQHIDSGEHRADFATEGYPSRWHRVRVEAGTKLDVFGDREFEINSRHHQAVTADGLASGLRPVAFASDHDEMLVEGMQSEQHRWVVAVQWHPERPEEHKPAFAPLMRTLFEALIEQASWD